MKRHGHAKPHPHERRRRRRRHVRAVLAGAMLCVPHPPRTPPTTRENAPVALSAAEETPLEPEISVTAEFYVPAYLAYESVIREAAKVHGVDPALVRAVIRAESAFDALAVSTAGAQGLMQLMPELSDELGVTDPFDPRQNIFGGVRYLKSLLDTYNGDEKLALAAYNAGPEAVETYSGVPPYPETQQYVRTITDRLARERAAATTEFH